MNAKNEFHYSVAKRRYSSTRLTRCFSLRALRFARRSDNSIRVWDITTGAEVRTVLGHLDDANSVTFLEGGKIVSASGDGTCKLWNLASEGKKNPDAPEHPHEKPIHAISISGDGKTLVTGAEDTSVKVWTWNRTSLEEQNVFKGHTRHVYCVDLSGRRMKKSLTKKMKAKLAVSGSRDGFARVWNLDHPKGLFEDGERKIKATNGDVFSVAFAPDDLSFFAGGGNLNKSETKDKSFLKQFR